MSEPSSVDAADAPSRARQLIAAGDVLVSTVRPNLNAVAYVKQELDGATASTGYCVLRPRPSDLDGRYLFHWVRAVPFVTHLVQRATGASYPAVSDKIVKAAPIQLPPMHQQRRIAAVLDAAEALRTMRREALATLDDLIQAVFVDMFGTDLEAALPSVPFANLLLKPLRNGISPSRTGSVKGDVLTLSAITGSSFEHTACKRSTFDKAHMDEKTVRRGDFLICRGNGNLRLVGRGSHPDRDMTTVAFPDTMIAASCNPDLISRAYLARIWHHRSVRAQVEGLARTTNGTYKINQGTIRSLLVPLPDIHRQREFDESEQEVAALRGRQISAAQRSDDLFASLQQRAFRGEL
ncbi:MAG: restriction endonuclease subunit S [Acidimicrobiaceae bacterium]|nr:restriction endonuclease subunit S [Acidimicrobiaceae bacterium]